MEYTKLTQSNLDSIVRKYVDYYNSREGGCWTYEKAYKRIHQVMTIEGAECLVQYDCGEPVGFLMGYYKEFDDLRGYYLEEIVIFAEHQNQGRGTALMAKLESVIRENGASLIELTSVNDAHHMHFYKKQGFYAANTLALMGKHFA